MDEFNIPYITAKQYICLKQIKKIVHDNNVRCEQAFVDTYDEIVENAYNISMPIYIYIQLMGLKFQKPMKMIVMKNSNA